MSNVKEKEEKKQQGVKVGKGKEKKKKKKMMRLKIQQRLERDDAKMSCNLAEGRQKNGEGWGVAERAPTVEENRRMK